MEFYDRKAKCKRIQKTDLNGAPLPEAFYALITDEITEEGTPLNAESMNNAVSYAMAPGQAALDNLSNLRSAAAGKIDSLQGILDSNFNFHTRPCTAREYDGLGLTALKYDGKDIKALDCDVCGELLLACDKQNPSGYGIFDLRDPVTGQKDFLQNILNKLYDLMTQPFTAEEYDGLDKTAFAYDGLNITAINFDMRGKSLVI